MHDEPEARVALHTRRSLVPGASSPATGELHPYATIRLTVASPLLRWSDGNPRT